MSPLAWLAVPVVVTLVAAVVVPWWAGRGRPELTDQQRAAIVGSALAPRPRGAGRWSPRRQGEAASSAGEPRPTGQPATADDPGRYGA